MTIAISGNGTITGISANGLPSGIITSTQIATGTITSTQIAANTIAASNILNTSKLDTGNMPAGSVVQVIYTEASGRAAYSTGSSLNSFDNLNFYADAGKISATITKLYSGSALRVTAGYSYMLIAGNNGLHGFVIWKDSSNKRNFSQDWGRDSSSTTGVYREFTAYFTGLSTGSHTFNAVPIRGNNAPPIGWIRNSNQGDMGDNVNANTTSFVMIEEIIA